MILLPPALPHGRIRARLRKRARRDADDGSSEKRARPSDFHALSLRCSKACHNAANASSAPRGTRTARARKATVGRKAARARRDLQAGPRQQT